MQKKIEGLIPHDKALHHIVCECIQCVIILIAFAFIGLWSIPLGFVICFVIQYIKEVKDRSTTGFDWSDIIYGMTGCIPISVVLLISMMFK